MLLIDQIRIELVQLAAHFVDDTEHLAVQMALVNIASAVLNN
ncbi:hypothetical protein [Amycolatopsis methanolica]